MLLRDFHVEVISPPLPQQVAAELTGFWEAVFAGPSFSFLRGVMAGREASLNRFTVWVARSDGRVAGTCSLMQSRAAPALGYVGEVAVDEAFRGRGLATELCGMAAEEFRGSGGRALLLATSNASAARVYHRLGWRRLAGSNVMMLVTDGRSPEEFLVDLYRDHPVCAVRAGGPADRVAMIPLIVTPHDWQVMDANAGVFSMRWAPQGSCEGLYPRYEALAADGGGAWFSLAAPDGRVLGLCTARREPGGPTMVDGFVHAGCLGQWPALMKEAIGWGLQRGPVAVRVSREDEAKQEMLESLGFGEARDGAPFEMAGRTVGGVVLRMGRTLTV